MPYRAAGFEDSKPIKVYVATQFTIIVFQSVLLFQVAWDSIIHNYGNPLPMNGLAWQCPACSLCQCVLIWSANTFLSFRIYALTKSRLQCGLVIALSTSAFILGIVTTAMTWRQALQSGSYLLGQAFTGQQNAISVAWHGLQAICESVITILLTRALMKSRSGYPRTDNIVNRIIHSVIQIGLLGSICALASLATWFSLRSTTVYEAFDMIVGSIYTHVIFDTLLSRVQRRERLAESSHIDFMVSTQLHPDIFQGPRASPVTKVPDGTASLISIENLSLATSETRGPRGTLEEGDVESKAQTSDE